MPTIDIDFDVFKALTARRPNERVTENDVLRALLGLPSKSDASTAAPTEEGGEWVIKRVKIPQGTELRASYKGETYLARVQNGALVLNGRRFATPSAAAMSITRNPVNGWTFWDCRLPGQASWQMLKTMRHK